MNFTDFNKKITIADGIDTRENDFISLSEYAKNHKELTIKGVFFTNGEYGKQVVAVTNGYNVNLPTRMVETFEEITNNEELLEAMKNGECKIGNFREYKKGRNKKTVIFDFL